MTQYCHIPMSRTRGLAPHLTASAWFLAVFSGLLTIELPGAESEARVRRILTLDQEDWDAGST